MRFRNSVWPMPFALGTKPSKKQIEAQIRLVEAVGKKETRTYEPENHNEELEKKVHDFVYQSCYDIAKQGLSKHERGEKFSELKETLVAEFSDDEQEEHGKLISKYFGKAQKEAIRELVLAEGIRLDGRQTTDIRPIWCEVDYLPSTHGSSVFTRGETQALATVTLGTSREANIIDSPSNQGEENLLSTLQLPSILYR